MTPEQAPAVEVSRLHKRFEGLAEAVEVLRGIDLILPAGTSLAVTGPSGSGKSTLLHILGTLDRPTSGLVRLEGIEPHRLAEPELAAFRNRRIGFVFQDHHLLPQYSVLENVLIPAMAAAARGRAAPAVRQRAQDLLERVGLAPRRSHRPAQISGGERQRAAVARALVNGPGLLLCDEPTGNLDAAAARAVEDLLFELPSREGATLIVVTHSPELASRCARRVRLKEGVCFEA